MWSCCELSNCWATGRADEPCWGEVSAVDEGYGETDYWWIHSCEGHDDLYFDSTAAYKPEPKESELGDRS